MPDCKFCGDTFESTARNRYGRTSVCSKIECKKKNAKLASQKGWLKRSLGLQKPQKIVRDILLPQGSWYWDVVMKNAIRDGKNPTEVVRKIKREMGSGVSIPMTDGVNKKLSAYLKKMGHSSRYNNKVVN